MDQLPPAVLAPIYHEAAQQFIGLKYGITASFVILAYDTLTTLDDEVEYIWKRKFSAVTFFFFMNRYYAIAITAFTLFVNILPAFTKAMCERLQFVTPFAGSITLTNTSNFIIALRVYALYNRSKALAAFFALYLIGELGVTLWVYATPSLELLSLPGPESDTGSLALHTCSAITSPKLSALQSASFQFMQTAFDSCALALIMWRTFRESLQTNSIHGIKRVILKHGILYYIVVFSLNLAWAIMVVTATDGIKYVMAGPVLALTPMAANRLTLSLRVYALQDDDDDASAKRPHPAKLRRRGSWMGTSTFEVRSDELATDGSSFELSTSGGSVSATLATSAASTLTFVA